MAQQGRFYLPPFSAVVNVVRETAKSLVPDDSPCMEMLRKATGGVTEPPEQSATTERSTHQRKQAAYSEVFESTTSYDEIEGENRPSRSSFDEQSYQRSRPHKFSISPGSFNADSEDLADSVDEFKSRQKINEWQAAWNVTNAIQVSFWFLFFKINLTIPTFCILGSESFPGS